jgi:hypothetical protein
MDDAREDRQRCRALADQLIAEYSGAVPPGQVLATVFRAHHALARHLELSVAARMSLCESSARQSLTDRIAGGRLDGGSRGTPGRINNPTLAS